MKTYQVLEELHYDQRVFLPGSEVELDEATDGVALAAIGVVADPDAPPAAAPDAPIPGAALDAGFAALREASPHQVREFAEAMAADPDIRAAIADGAGPTVDDVLDAGLEALRGATPDQVREFAKAMAVDPDIRAAVVGEPDRDEAIARACRALRFGRDEASWTGGGLPTVEAVEAITGLDVSAAERNQGWAVATGSA